MGAWESRAAARAPGASPRFRSRIVPSASTTTTSPSTQSRVLPYLKVAGPAALVATTPPAHAPVKVGAGGNHAPHVARCSCSSAIVTPASTVTCVAVVSIDPPHLRGREHELAHRRRAAGQRRLRADRKDGHATPARTSGDLFGGPREHDAGRDDRRENGPRPRESPSWVASLDGPVGLASLRSRCQSGWLASLACQSGRLASARVVSRVCSLCSVSVGVGSLCSRCQSGRLALLACQSGAVVARSSSRQSGPARSPAGVLAAQLGSHGAEPWRTRPMAIGRDLDRTCDPDRPGRRDFGCAINWPMQSTAVANIAEGFEQRRTSFADLSLKGSAAEARSRLLLALKRRTSTAALRPGSARRRSCTRRSEGSIEYLIKSDRKDRGVRGRRQHPQTRPPRSEATTADQGRAPRAIPGTDRRAKRATPTDDWQPRAKRAATPPTDSERSEPPD